jgi:hypothetical protein
MNVWHKLRHVSPTLTALASLLACLGCSGSSEAPTLDPRDDAGVPGADATPDTTTNRPDGDATPSGRFQKLTLHRQFYCEGASFGDFDRDGRTDVVAGPHWYAGPEFTEQRVIWSVQQPFDPKGYSDCFFQWVRDFDADGWLDVLVVGFPGADASWYENPGNATAAWARHRVIEQVDAESPEFVDLTGDGKPELVFAQGGRLGWAGPGSDPATPWVFHPLTDVRGYSAFLHGLGTGDLDGDQRADVLEATGFWRQPAALVSDPLWTRADQAFGPGGAQMATYDVDGDGDADVVTTLAAHGYGLAWYEQTAPNAAAFQEHVIVSPDPPAAGAEVVLHEPHALAVADIDGDGLTDIVTGERFWGHVPEGEPDFGAPGRLYWFRLERTADGPKFTPMLIDSDSGVGTQVTVGDATDDGLLDIVVANKKGAFVFVQEPGP